MRYPWLVLPLACLAVLGLASPHSLARDDGRWSAADPAKRQWFRSQISPKTGQMCCDEADGTEAEEDIRDGRYWARWKIKARGYDLEYTTEWTLVPDDVVIRDPNRNGSPVVWWWFEGGKPAVRCYAPGAGI